MFYIPPQHPGNTGSASGEKARGTKRLQLVPKKDGAKDGI